MRLCVLTHIAFPRKEILLSYANHIEKLKYGVTDSISISLTLPMF